MKKSTIVFSSAVLAASAFAAQVDRVLVRQMWPWSSEVRVEYSVSGTTAPAAVSIAFFDGTTPLAPTDLTALQGDTAYAGNGMHAVTFDPKALFGLTDTQQFADFRVQVTLGEESALMSDKLYRIIDLDTGKVTDLIRADFYNNKGYGTYETNFSVFGSGGWNTSLQNVLVWTGVTNNPIYKTSKIVMRYITAKNQTFTMGGSWHSTGQPAHSVTLTNDYYLSVFEVTQAQLYKLTGSYGSPYGNAEDKSVPAFGRWDTVWGRPNSWPNGRHNVTMTSGDFLGELRSLVGGSILFDFPTEAQWEFACRAGTDTQYYTGLSSTTDKAKLGYLIDKGNTSASYPAAAGSFLPNAFGLYDMYSNAHEWCLDWFEDYSEDAQTDPVGPSATSTNSDYNKKRVTRGAHFNGVSATKTGATVYRSAVQPTANSSLAGCRLWCPAD